MKGQAEQQPSAKAYRGCPQSQSESNAGEESHRENTFDHSTVFAPFERALAPRWGTERILGCEMVRPALRVRGVSPPASN